MHVESPSTRFGATMCYVALRLLGVGCDEECMARGRSFLHAHGGCTYTGSWAKF
jgi:lanosterol synthase